MNYILDNYSIDEMFEEIDYENVCQITEKPLNKFHIKLKCGHKFNYESIFNEVKKQKINTNRYRSNIKLKHWQIRCPYCRYVEPKLLPYHPDFPKIKYVNWPNNLCMKADYLNCSYKFLSGKRKGQTCGKMCVDDMCKMHIKITEKRAQKQKEKIATLAKATNIKISKNTSNNPFTPKCCHIFKRGARSGEQCCKIITFKETVNKKLIYNKNKNYKSTDKFFCSKHAKLKCNSKFI